MENEDIHEVLDAWIFAHDYALKKLEPEQALAFAGVYVIQCAIRDCGDQLTRIGNWGDGPGSPPPSSSPSPVIGMSPSPAWSTMPPAVEGRA